MIITIAVLVIASQSPVQENATRPPAPSAAAVDTILVSLDEMVRAARINNLRALFAAAETQGVVTNATATRSRFDPVLNLGGDSEIGGVGGQLVGLAPTGARYLLGSVAPSALPGEPLYSNALVASVSQPVLRGLGPRSARTSIRATDEGVAASRARLARTRDEITSEISIAYAVLVARHREEAIAARSVSRADELRAAYTVLRDLQRITEVDLLTAELGVASRRSALLAVRRERREAEDALVFAVYGASAATMLPRDDAALVPRDTVVAAESLPSIEALTERALAARPDLAAARHELARAELQFQFSRNAALPALNLLATFSSTDTTAGGASAATGPRLEEWSYGFVLSRPLRNMSASAERERTTAMRAQAALALAEAENTVRAEVRSAYRDITLGREQTALAAEATRLARAQYGGERERLTLGLTDLFRVLQYEEQVARVERAEAAAWLSYATSMVRYRLVLGGEVGTPGAR